eukprot:TRINITY_DN5411_c0_g1_i1.p1 TRINITY_DN5411_c0_g1~~TRINITY_DN5411_c0_g1_i1.p1  ORF type:complete len:440 (+),score=97.61 TRINITY_DN5411_c0_g1_i1:124-1320(+)
MHLTKELALNAPHRFLLSHTQFFERVWIVLTDNRPSYRELAAETLHVTLELVKDRENKMETNSRYNWTSDSKLKTYFHKLLQDAHKGLKSNDASVVHGSLLALGELYQLTMSEAMNHLYPSICEDIFNLKESKDKVIKKTSTTLICKMAYYSPSMFDFKTVIVYFINTLKGKDFSIDWPPALLSISDLIKALGAGITSYLDIETLLTKIRISLTSKKGKTYCIEAVVCLGSIGKFTSLTQFFKDDPNTINSIFSGGLSNTLVEALSDMLGSNPQLRDTVQIKLLEILEKIFKAGSHHSGSTKDTPGSSGSSEPSASTRKPTMVGSVSPSEESEVHLAFKTLRTFGYFESERIGDLLKDQIVNYLDDDLLATRKEAAATCCDILLKLIGEEQTKPRTLR